MSIPDKTLEAAIELLEARLQHPPTMFYTRPIALAAATRTVIAALNRPTITPAEPSDWFAGDVDCDGNRLVTVRWDELVEHVRHAPDCPAGSDQDCTCGAVAFLDKGAPTVSLRSTPPAAGEGQAEAYITEEWCLRMAELEGDAEVGAGFESVTPLIAPAAGEEVTEADHELAEAIYSYGKGRPVKLGKGHSTAEWIARHRLFSLRSTPPAAGEGDAETYLRRVLDANSDAHVTVPEALLRNVLDRLATRSADVERLTRAVLIAETVFDEYARLHREKGTPDGERKAIRNEQYADEMRSALTGQPVTPNEEEGT